MAKECLRCGNVVCDDYHRVNCNNHGELWSCIECTPGGETLTGPDDESDSSVYERNLDKIRDGVDVPEIGRYG